MAKRKLRINPVTLYTILFIVVFGLIFIPFMIKGLSTVWEIDGVGQYYPAFLYIGQTIRDFLRTGNFNFFDLEIALGEDVFSALNYYGFGDPLNILAIFATKTSGAYIFAFMFFLRLYLSGIAFILYSRYMRLDEKLCVPGAFMYLCSGYMFCACLMYSQYLSILMYFPLLLLAVEKQIKENKWWGLSLVSLYAALCTVYLLYYAVLFLIPYTLVRAIFYYEKDIKEALVKCAMCALSSVIGVVVAFPVLFPVLKGMMKSKRSGGSVSNVLFSLTNYRPRRFNIIQFIKGFIPTYSEGIYFFHEIPVLSYVAIVILLVMFFVLKKRTRRNIQLMIGVLGGCIFYTMPISNLVFSGFMEGSSYDRWIFILEFLFAVCFVSCVSDIVRDKFNENFKAYLAVYVIVLLNVIAAGMILYSVTGKEFTEAFIPFADIQKYVDSPVNYSETIAEDESIFRISNDSITGINGRPENVQMINGYNGLTFWLSVINPNTQDIADRLPELNSNGYVSYRMYGLENNKVYESLAGVKYYLRRDNEQFPDDYVLTEKLDFYGDEWEVYENPDVLPLVYAYDIPFYNEKLEEGYYLGNEDVIYRAAKAENVSYDKDRISCEIDLEEDSVIILAIPYSDGFSVTIDDVPSKVYNSNINYMMVYAKTGHHKIVYQYSAYESNR